MYLTKNKAYLKELPVKTLEKILKKALDQRRESKGDMRTLLDTIISDTNKELYKRSAPH